MNFIKPRPCFGYFSIVITCKGHDTVVSLSAGCDNKISHLESQILVFVILFFELGNLASEIWKPLNFGMPLKFWWKKICTLVCEIWKPLNFGMPLKFWWKKICTLIFEIWKPLNFGMPLRFWWKNICTLVCERSIFQTVWRANSCTIFLFLELETSNFGCLLIFRFPFIVQSFGKIGQH